MSTISLASLSDWNGDGIDDLIVGRGQDTQVLILFGGKGGLDLKRSTVIPVDYRHYYETGLHVADFNGDGRADVAGLGYVNTGLVLGIYIYLGGEFGCCHDTLQATNWCSPSAFCSRPAGSLDSGWNLDWDAPVLSETWRSFWPPLAGRDGPEGRQ